MVQRWLPVLVWVGLTAGFAATALYRQWSTAVATHEHDAGNLYRIVSQRVDQHDAHLTGISALTTSSSTPPLEALRAVAATIIQFYPRILAVDVVMIEQGAEPVALYTSRVDQDAVPANHILAAAHRGSRRAEVVVAPGGSGRYLLVKRAPNSDAAKYALSLEIDGQRLVETDGGASTAATALALAGADNIYASPHPLGELAAATVRLQSDKTLASASQPLRLSLRRQVPVMSLVPWGVIAAFAAATGSLLWLLGNMLTARRAEREAVARAAASAQEARLAHANRINAMGELSLGIAHELTQPLAALLSQSQAGLRMIKADVLDHRAITGVLEANARHAKRAGELLKKLRDWNSADPPSNQVVDLNQVITEISSLNRADLDRRGVDFELELLERSPKATADQVGVEQIVQNLLANARDACEDAPRHSPMIVIRTFEAGEMVGFSVCDVGPGITDDIAGRLFEPFFTSKPEGMGLGLSICRRLVDRFGGEIRAANREDGAGGAIVTVVLPAYRFGPEVVASRLARAKA
jgi:two-component system, LuxR family, sensor kinase FixL